MMSMKRMAPWLAALALVGACVGAAGCTSDAADEGSAGQGSTTQAVSTAEATQVGAVEITCTSDMVGQDAETTQAWTLETVYDEDSQAAIKADLDAAKDGQTLEEPLVEYNPFGTNTLSLYVYFTTDEAASVTYTVSVSDEDAAAIDDETLTSSSISDFTRDVDDGESSTEHEFQVIGLIRSTTNTVTVTATYEDGTAESCVITADMCGTIGDEELQLEVTEGDSTEELEDGLYVILGNDSPDQDFIYYYDNDGFLRGEIPIIGYRAHRLLFDDDGVMYYSASESRMAAMDELGQITRVYFLGDYDLHHDYVWEVENETMYILATDTTQNETVEDLVVRLDVETGDVELVLDMRDLMGDVCDDAIAYHEANYEPLESDEGDETDDDGVDWIHLNTIQYLADEDAVILSCREISSIIKVENLTTDPSIGYILASHEFWEGTEYDQYVYDQASDFLIHGGQHTVTYLEDESLEDGQYYLYMYNNNIGLSEAVTHDFDYTSIGITNDSPVSDDEYSYYYLYLVDENEGTFDLVDSLDVVLSGYASGVQWYEDNLIIDSGIPGVFAEYDADHNLIRSFYMERDNNFLFRVFKYDL